MKTPTQPQQLSFDFEEPIARQTVVSLASASASSAYASEAATKGSPAVVYDFRAVAAKRKETAHASLYRQILDSVRHIG